MMKKIGDKLIFNVVCFLVLLFASITAVSAQLNDEIIYNSQFLDMEITIESGLQLKPTSGAAFADYVNADLLLFPRATDYQKVFSVKPVKDAPTYERLGGTNTNEKIGLSGKDDIVYYNDKLRFTWDKPSTEKLLFGVTGPVRVENRYAPIAQKIDFPVNIDLLPEHILIYTLPTKNIDSDDEAVARLASEIVKGEDDYYKAVFKVAKWVKTNINYSLDTLTAEAVQKSSWVLQHREGVCDELTALFIGMARSLGLPARYISGVAYTNWNNINDWGPHAWAEVYFPITKDIGVWVPYDVTYGQFGYVDPTHIILRINDDSDSTSTKYEWRGKNVELDTAKLNVKAKLLDHSGKLIDNIRIKIEPVKKAVGFGSYNLIKATVNNILPTYTATEIYLAKTTDIEILGEQTKQLILLPNEEKIVYWSVKISDNLNRNYIYTMPAHVYSVTNVSSQAAYGSTAKDPVYSLDDIQSLMTDDSSDESTADKNEQLGRYDFDIKCKAAKEQYYSDEEVAITCTLRNTGNFIADNLNVCLKENCKELSLVIGQAKDAEFSINYAKDLKDEMPGKKDLIVKAKHEKVSKAASAVFELIPLPKVEIKELYYPAALEFGRTFVVNFTMEPSSPAKNAVLVIKNEYMAQEWKLDDLNESRRFSITLNSNSLTLKPNLFKIILTYNDNLGKEYTALEEFIINLENVTFGQKLQIWLNSVGRALAKMVGG